VGRNDPYPGRDRYPIVEKGEKSRESGKKKKRGDSSKLADTTEGPDSFLEFMH